MKHKEKAKKEAKRFYNLCYNLEPFLLFDKHSVKFHTKETAKTIVSEILKTLDKTDINDFEKIEFYSEVLFELQNF